MTLRENLKNYLNRSKKEGRIVIFPTGMGSEVGALGAEQIPPYTLSSPLWVVGALLDKTGQDLIRKAHRNSILKGKVDFITTPTWTRITAIEEEWKKSSNISTRGIELTRERFDRIGLEYYSDWKQAAHEILARGVKLSLEVRNEMEPIVDRTIRVGASFGPLANSHDYTVDERLAKYFDEGVFGPTATHYDYALAEKLSTDYYLAIHRETAAILANAGKEELDFLIPETINTYFEAWAMAKAASETGLPFIIGLRPNKDASFPDGSNLANIINRLKDFPGFTAIAINCVPPEWVPGILEKVRQSYDGPLVVYSNGPGIPHPNNIDWIYDFSDKAINGFEESTTLWAQNHHVIGVGGCCGSRADVHGRALARAFWRQNSLRTELRCEG